ncbi:MAG: hypothetical protein ACR2OE_05615 [Thermomicrobiales bacterium]
MRDLEHATRDELIRIILDQRDMLAEQERRLAALTEELVELRQLFAQVSAHLGAARRDSASDDPPSASRPKGMPGLKPTEAPVREPHARKPRAHDAGRHRLEATVQQVHALEACPDCGTVLAGGSIKRRREVVALPVPTVVVTTHV